MHRYTICLVATLLGCQNASSLSEVEKAVEQSAAATPPLRESVPVDEHPVVVQSAAIEPHPSAKDPTESPAIRQLISKLEGIDDEDDGKFSLEKKERWNAIFKELQQSPAATTAAMLRMLKSENSYARACAANVLGRTRDKIAINDLVRALRDSDPIVQSCAALALGWVGDDKAVPALVEAMEDEHGGVRQQVAKALGHIASAQATKSLIAAIKFKEDVPTCSVYAPMVIISMGRVRHPGRYNEPPSWSLAEIGLSAIEDLCAALEDPSGINHVYLAWSLAEITTKHGNMQALQALIRARNHADGEVREFVDETLSKMRESQEPQMASLKEMIQRLDFKPTPHENDPKSDDLK